MWERVGTPAEEWTRDSWEREFGRAAPTRLIERWPRDKRIAVLLTFDTQGDIDAARPGYQTTMRANGVIHYFDQMERQYEVKRGLQRILRILQEYGVKATFPTCGKTADWYPDVVARIHEAGHEIACHTYGHWPMQHWPRDEQRREIELGTEAIERIIGKRPAGWRSWGYASNGVTMDLLIEAGYLWAGDFPNDDLPYWLERPNGRLLAMPACIDDMNMYLMPVPGYSIHATGNYSGSPQHVLNSWLCEFDLLYEESALEPQICSLTLHPRVSGRPFRAWALRQFIRHALAHPGVWFATCGEIAALC